MRTILSSTLKSAGMAMLMACFSSIYAAAYRPEFAVASGAGKTADAALHAGVDKTGAVAALARNTDCYLALHQDMAGTPFLHEMTDTAADKAAMCRGARPGRSTCGEPL